MTTYYRSTIGETRTFKGWDEEATKFYNKLDGDKDIPIAKPSDWWERWTKVLRLEELT